MVGFWSSKAQVEVLNYQKQCGWMYCNVVIRIIQPTGRIMAESQYLSEWMSSILGPYINQLSHQGHTPQYLQVKERNVEVSFQFQEIWSIIDYLQDRNIMVEGYGWVNLFHSWQLRSKEREQYRREISDRPKRYLYNPSKYIQKYT